MEAFSDAVAVGENKHTQNLMLPRFEGFAEGFEKIKPCVFELFE